MIFKSILSALLVIHPGLDMALEQKDTLRDSKQTRQSTLPSLVGGIDVEARILSNKVSHARGGERHLYLYIEPNGFTEPRLRKIFESLADVYDPPRDLRISAFSDLEIFKKLVFIAHGLPSSVPVTAEGATNTDRLEVGYFRAYYRRGRSGEEVISYSPDPQSPNMRNAILNSNPPHEYLNDQKADLRKGAENGDEAKVRELLDQGADVNSRYGHEFTPLMYAVLQGHTEMVRLLLSSGANPNLRTNADRTALMYAAYSGNSRMIDLLLSYNADILITDRAGVSALALAVLPRHTDVIRTLLMRGANPNARTDNSRTALMVAVSNDWGEILKMLLEKGADVNARDDEGRTALMLQFNDKQTVRSLLDAGADLEAKDQKGWTALMYAVDHLYEEKVAVLLEAGANVNAAGRNGETALTIAARYRGNQEIARLLKRAGAR